MWRIARPKRRFPPERRVSRKVGDAAFARGLVIYPGSGNVDGERGDQVMLAPPFIVTDEQLDEIVSLLAEAIGAVL